MKYESENIEYKITYTPDLYKEVIAFVNTDGGTIYIGVDNDGNEIGLTDVDKVYTQITNGIRDAINPDITMFIKYHLQDNNIIRIEVTEGTDKPYYLKSKGLKPSGVYVRQGTSSVQTSLEQIRNMIKLSDGDIFEVARSINQDLTFNTLEAEFKSANIEIKHSTLGITNLKTKEFTNLGNILSEQCPYTIKVAVFSDKENTIFRDRKEFTGSVLEQYHKVADYLLLCNKVSSNITDFKRNDSFDYPILALRECLLNAIIHRDYTYSGSIIININDYNMEFISLGGLMAGLSKEDIISGVSLARNEHLAEIFRKLGYVESYGTGLRRIFNLYKDFPISPEINLTPHAFKIILPNMNSNQGENNIVISKQGQKIINYLKEHSEMTTSQIEKLLNIKKTRAYTITKQLANQGIIEIVGRGESKKYRLCSNSH